MVRVVEVGAGERLAPVFEHAGEVPILDVPSQGCLRQACQSEPRNGRASQDAGIVDRYRPVDLDLHHLVRSLELPASEAAGRGGAIVQARMSGQIVRRLRMAVPHQIVRLADDRDLIGRGQAHGRHVLRQPLSDRDTRLEAFRHDIRQVVVGDHLQLHAGLSGM